MDERKETLSFFIYMWNKWSMNEASLVFNEKPYDENTWRFSFGEHMWNKYLDYDRRIDRFVAEIDETCLSKLVERACSLYCGRKNK